MSTFDEALRFTLSFEGLFVDDPADRGGATNMGVTQAVYDDWRDGCGLPRESVRNIKPETVSNVYRTLYWTPAGCGGMDRALAMVAFDIAVNHGVGRARQWLKISRVPSTLLKIRRTSYLSIVARHPSQAKFLKGWLRRTDALAKAVGA